ncbi:MAG: iron permease, partial [Gimesia sp.]
MKPLSHFKKDAKIALFLLMIPLVIFLVAPEFFIAQPTQAAEQNLQNSVKESAAETAAETTNALQSQGGKTWTYTLL